MIPDFALNEWRQQAPWTTSAMVEQDLVITRALTELYNNPVVNTTELVMDTYAAKLPVRQVS